MGVIFQYIYTRKLWAISLFFCFVMLLWITINRLSSKKKTFSEVWKVFNIVCFVAITGAILYYTIFSRSSDIHEINLKPFYTFELAKQNVEFYRSMLMNVFLFVPFGLTLFVSLPDKFGNKLLLIILTSLLLSVVLESIQYVFALGRTEVDDVICNVFGAFVGALFCNFSKTKN